MGALDNIGSCFDFLNPPSLDLERNSATYCTNFSLPSGNDSSGLLQHCNILRRAAEAGGLLVDAMNNTLDGSREDLSSVPLMVVENGCGSPCIDLRQVSSELAAAAKEADLVRRFYIIRNYIDQFLMPTRFPDSLFDLVLFKFVDKILMNFFCPDCS